MKMMYAITHVGDDGLRRLTFANQGRNHYATREGAESALAAFRDGPEGLVKVLTPGALASLRVDLVECYDHGDAVGIYVQD